MKNYVKSFFALKKVVSIFSVLATCEKLREISSKPSSVWKFLDFCVNQILREINFGESQSWKPVIFCQFWTLHFVDLVSSSPKKCKNFQKIKIESLYICWNGRYCTLRYFFRDETQLKMADVLISGTVFVFWLFCLKFY